jgi:hypothetical protein
MAEPVYTQVPHTNPATKAAAITGTDTYTVPTRAIYAGAGGTLTVTMAGDLATTTFKVVAGSVLPLSVIEVTAAPADCVALW